ncbi:class I SAM-dependent DNA methyltransferase [Pseudoroseomonas wenyumeiae]
MLEGVDLSPRMLAAARARGIYDALHEADLLDVLPARPGHWGLVAAADVLNYLGDLSAALPAMAAALAPGGLAAFSLEKGRNPPAPWGPTCATATILAICAPWPPPPGWRSWRSGRPSCARKRARRWPGCSGCCAGAEGGGRAPLRHHPLTPTGQIAGRPHRAAAPGPHRPPGKPSRSRLEPQTESTIDPA